jgi:hypothetical protein
MANDLLNEKMDRINDKALIAFNKIEQQHTAAKEALNNAIMNLEEAEEQKKIDTDEYDNYHAYISKERMKANEEKLYKAKQEFYTAEDKFEELENKFIRAQAHKEACKLYKTKKANLSSFEKIQVSKLSLSDLGIIVDITKKAYETIRDNEMMIAETDYKSKEKVYKTALDEANKTAAVNTKRGFLGLFRNKDKDREALYKYYKEHNTIKVEVKHHKKQKNIARLEYEKYAFLASYLRKDWDDAIARRKLPLAEYNKVLASEDNIYDRMTAEVNEELSELSPEKRREANERHVITTSGDIQAPASHMTPEQLQAHAQWRKEKDAEKDARIDGGHKKNNTKRRRRNTKKQLIMKRK